jgi:predicted aminopeptidase
VFARLRQRYAALKAGWGGFAGYDRFFVDEPDNALLVSFETYSGLVAGFERLLAAEGGDLERFYVRSAQLAARPYAERRSVLGGYPPGLR